MDCNKSNYGMGCNMNCGANGYGMNNGMVRNYSVNRNSSHRMNMDMANYSRDVNDDECCNIVKDHIDHMNPGMAYVPWQKWECVYDMEKGFERGTIFEQLDKPFIGRCMK